MTSYSADSPLDARVRFGAGTLEVEASTSGTASATVEALDPTDRAAAVMAGQARIDLDGHRLTVQVPGKGLELQSTTGEVIVKGGGVALDLREAASGSVRFEVGSGSAHVGVLEGTTVQVDLTSGMGEVRCDVPLESSVPSGGVALRLRLRTGSGDLIVGRAGVPSQDHRRDRT
jgi:hypothetical protein